MDSFSSTPEEQWKASKVSLPESTMAALKGETNRKQYISTIPLLVLCLSYMPLIVETFYLTGICLPGQFLSEHPHPPPPKKRKHYIFLSLKSDGTSGISHIYKKVISRKGVEKATAQHK